MKFFYDVLNTKMVNFNINNKEALTYLKTVWQNILFASGIILIVLARL